MSEESSQKMDLERMQYYADQVKKSWMHDVDKTNEMKKLIFYQKIFVVINQKLLKIDLLI